MKKTISILLCIVLSISILCVPVLAARDTSAEQALASDLKTLGVFQGVSDTNFDLNRAPSRVEALVMLVRLLGKENDALNGSWSCPFTDVPAWAESYVAYAYAAGLTDGVSSTQFGTGTAGAETYLTFVLRALGYSDSEGDFTWSNPYSLADSVGILPDSVSTSAFLRADVVSVSYAALNAKIKNSSAKLSDKLIDAGVFTRSAYSAVCGAAASGSASSAGLASSQIYSMSSEASFFIEVYNDKGYSIASGSGFFISADGLAVTCYHVIQGGASAKVQIRSQGRFYDVKGVCDYSAAQDWAVIQVAGSGFSSLELGDARAVAAGDTVYAMGNAMSAPDTLTSGSVTNPLKYDGGVVYIQNSAPIKSGFSGGALLNQYGQVIGIIAATYDGGASRNLAVRISAIGSASASDFIPLKNVA